MLSTFLQIFIRGAAQATTFIPATVTIARLNFCCIQSFPIYASLGERSEHLKDRQLEREIMDDPALQAEQHFDALSGLERLNRWSRSTSIVWPAIHKLARRNPKHTLEILDIATGGGDIPIGIYQRALKTGVSLRVSGCDLSVRAVEYARQRAREAKAAVEFFEFNAVRDVLPKDYDVILSSLFLHHLESEQIEVLLRKMVQRARHMVLINDLVRNHLGLSLAHVATRLLTSSKVVHSDGPQSVRAAFTLNEVRAIAARADLQNITLVRRWPCRFLLTWTRNA